MYIVRLVCKKHDIDLECIETNINGNPDDALFKVWPDESHYSCSPTRNLAERCGVIDNRGKVLKPGTWYTLDLSSFACPRMASIPEGISIEEEDSYYCANSWAPVIEEVSDLCRST